MKEQKIIVLLRLDPSDKMLILNGLKIASLFRKELCLFYNVSKKEKKHYNLFKQKLTEYSLTLKKDIPEIKVSTLILSENLTHLPEKLSDDFEAIFLIASTLQFSKYSKALTESPIPFLFVDVTKETVSEFKNLVIPVDLRKENSDLALWSSYFGRFNSTEIVVVAANDKDKDNQQQVAKNVVLTKKLFAKFKLPHKVFRGQKSSFGNTFEALELAISTKADIFAMLSSSVITPLDLIVGLPERKIIKKASGIPVLVINPRKDNYILCD